MTDQPDQSIAWYSIIIQEGPGFLYGFLLGVISGYFGNWAWAKLGPKRTDSHMTLEVTESGAHFTGLMNQDNSEQILKVMKAAATKPASKPGGTTYDKSNAQTKTNK